METWSPSNRSPLPVPLYLQSGLPHLCVCPVLALGQCDQNCVDIGPHVTSCGVSPTEVEVVFGALYSLAVRTWVHGLTPPGSGSLI